MTKICEDYERRSKRLPMLVGERLEFISPLGRVVTVLFREEREMVVMSGDEVCAMRFSVGNP